MPARWQWKCKRGRAGKHNTLYNTKLKHERALNNGQDVSKSQLSWNLIRFQCSCSFHSLLGPNVSSFSLLELNYIGHRFWGGGWATTIKIVTKWSSQASKLPQLLQCQVQCQIAETFLATKREAKNRRNKNKRLKTRTCQSQAAAIMVGWITELATPPFGATSGGFSTWLAGRSLPFFFLFRLLQQPLTFIMGHYPTPIAKNSKKLPFVSFFYASTNWAQPSRKIQKAAQNRCRLASILVEQLYY